MELKLHVGDNTLKFHALHAHIWPRTRCQKLSPLFVRFVSVALTANKDNNGVESMRWDGPRDPGFQYSYCSLGNVSRLIIYTTSPSFPFYCFFFCIVYTVYFFFYVLWIRFQNLRTGRQCLIFERLGREFAKYFFKFQMPITSSKIWFETRFVYDEYDWYCR